MDPDFNGVYNRVLIPRETATNSLGASTTMVDPRPLRTQCGTLSPVAKTVPVREFRTNLSAFLSDVADRRDHVLVTRNGKPAAALVPIDEYDALEETAEILSDSETLAAIEAGLAEFSRDETVTLADLRAELDVRRSTR
jgi:prevent-host-death family protein